MIMTMSYVIATEINNLIAIDKEKLTYLKLTQSDLDKAIT